MNFPSYLDSPPAAVLKVRGSDAFPFLQGQFTQDLRPQNSRRSAYGLWLNQKGKVLGDSFALEDGDTWWLVSLSTPAAALRERLEAYVIADDVELSDETADWAAWSFLGAAAAPWLAARGLTLPEAGQWAPADAGRLFPGRAGLGGAWIWLRRTADGAPAGLDALTRLDPVAFARMRIEAGVVSVPEDVGPTDLPNEGGLEREAISYTKGCYLGQEIMARLHMQGQVRRQLLRVRGAGQLPEPSHRRLLSSAGKQMGELRTLAPLPESKGWVGFAMVSLIGLDREATFSVEGAAGSGPVRLEGLAS